MVTALIEKLAHCIERGKVDRGASYPPDMQGEDGADELTQQALAAGCSPAEILERALTVGMRRIGDKFGSGKAFIPDLLISARALHAAMRHLEPYFAAGEVQRKGTVILGTVSGDLHDIGKNIVKLVLQGDGWEVIDLGVDVAPAKFIDQLEAHPQSLIGLSAMLTTTMLHMGSVVQEVKMRSPATPIYVGGAPLSQEFSDKIGADGYFKDPYCFVDYLRTQRGQ